MNNNPNGEPAHTGKHAPDALGKILEELQLLKQEVARLGLEKRGVLYWGDRSIPVVNPEDLEPASRSEGEASSQRAPPGPGGPEDILVCLDQIAASVGKSKRTLEKYKYKKPPERLPEPDVRGRGGRASYWYWSRIRLWLESTFGLLLGPLHPYPRRALPPNV